MNSGEAEGKAGEERRGEGRGRQFAWPVEARIREAGCCVSVFLLLPSLVLAATLWLFHHLLPKIRDFPTHFTPFGAGPCIAYREPGRKNDAESAAAMIYSFPS